MLLLEVPPAPWSMHDLRAVSDELLPIVPLAPLTDDVLPSYHHDRPSLPTVIHAIELEAACSNSEACRLWRWLWWSKSIWWRTPSSYWGIHTRHLYGVAIREIHPVLEQVIPAFTESFPGSAHDLIERRLYPRGQFQIVHRGIDNPKRSCEVSLSRRKSHPWLRRRR